MLKPDNINKYIEYFEKTAIHIILILAIGLIAYSNTLNVPFVFDDIPNIVENSRIRDLKNYIYPSLIKQFAVNNSRFIGGLSFAFNYHINGLNVTGYHVVNLIIHLINATLVYYLVTLTLKLIFVTSCEAYEKKDCITNTRGLIALFTALIFVSHPIQTQGVTYVIQRFTSLATLFYIISVVTYIKSRISVSRTGRFLFYSLSLGSSVIAMKTKEIAFTIPFIIVLYDFMFLSDRRKNRSYFLIPIVLTSLVIPLSLVGSHTTIENLLINIDKSTRLLTNLSRSDYLFTEFKVIVTYIRLLFLPVAQNLDYDYPISNSFWSLAVFTSFLFLMLLLYSAFYFYQCAKQSNKDDTKFYRLISFGIFWFFITLSVESSIIPIADVIFEHRMYLPSVGAFIALTTAIFSVAYRFKKSRFQNHNDLIIALVVVVLLFTVASYARNTTWQSEVVLWNDVILKSPNKARAHNNLGAVYVSKGNFEKAIEQSRIALSLDHGFFEAYNNIGIAYSSKGNFDSAIEQFQSALNLNSNYAEAHNNLGLAYAYKGMSQKAVDQFQYALRLKPEFVDAHNNLGALYASIGLIGNAVEQFEAALKFNPNDAKARKNLELVSEDLLKQTTNKSLEQTHKK